MKRIILNITLLLIASDCFAQSPATLAPNIYAAGGQYLSTGSPKGAAWFAYGHLISQSAGLYSYSEEDIFLVKGVIKTAPSTGVAVVLRQLWGVTLLVFGTAGVATDGASAVGAFPYGAIADYKVGKTDWHVLAGWKQIAVTGSETQSPIFLGVGRTW